jgi:GntR family transcriptional regulator
MITFYLEPDSGLPTYLQLGRQVEHGIRLGRLQPGDQLPSIRDVVAALAINPNTVAKAYRDLEARGLVESRQGRGTFVARTSMGWPPADDAALRRKLGRWLAEAATNGLSREHVATVFEAALREAFAEGAA